MKIEDAKPSMKIRYQWAPRSLTRPAKFVEVEISESHFDCRDGGQDWFSVAGTATPQWGEGKYSSFPFRQALPAHLEVELV